MIILLLFQAMAACLYPYELASRVDPVVYQDQRIEVRSEWGQPKALLARHRVRGPTGDLIAMGAVAFGRFFELQPLETLAPGTYTLEEHAAFSTDGKRIDPSQWNATTEGWFTVDSFEVVEGEAPAEPTEWSILRRTRDGLVAPFPADARWVDVEVEGVGVVSRSRKEVVDTMAPMRCNCTDAWVRLPKLGPVTARTITRLHSGASRTSRWTTFYRVEGWNPLRWEDFSEVKTWERVGGTTPVDDATGECAGAGGEVGDYVVLGETRR